MKNNITKKKILEYIDYLEYNETIKKIIADITYDYLNNYGKIFGGTINNYFSVPHIKYELNDNFEKFNDVFMELIRIKEIRYTVGQMKMEWDIGRKTLGGLATLNRIDKCLCIEYMSIKNTIYSFVPYLNFMVAEHLGLFLAPMNVIAQMPIEFVVGVVKKDFPDIKIEFKQS